MSKFIDIYGNIFKITGELGRGGQGVVYKTQDGDCAIKVRINAKGEEGTDPKFDNKLKNILRLPIRDISEIVLPAQKLQDFSGYVMPLISNMTSIEKLLNHDTNNYNNIPAWIENIKDNKIKALFANFLYTGSLEKRIEILMKISAVLMQLHNRGLVYCDISLNNIFYSIEDNKTYVALIDADNIRFNDRVEQPIYTPKYSAPELLNKGYNSILADCFSFAVVAFYILSYSHPFEGKITEDTTINDWDKSTNQNKQEYINLYDYPWIYNEEDDSNEAIHSLPYELIVNEELQFLFNKMFTIGIKNINKRPVMAEFYYALLKALNKIVQCKNCNITYFYNQKDIECPYCENKNNNIITIKTISKNSNKTLSHFYKSYDIGENLYIPYSAFMNYEVSKIYEDAIILKVEKDFIELQIISDIFNENNKGKLRITNKYYKLENKLKTIEYEISVNGE